MQFSWVFPKFGSVQYFFINNLQNRKITKLTKLLDTAVVGRMAGADRNSWSAEVSQKEYYVNWQQFKYKVVPAEFLWHKCKYE